MPVGRIAAYAKRLFRYRGIHHPVPVMLASNALAARAAVHFIPFPAAHEVVVVRIEPETGPAPAHRDRR